MLFSVSVIASPGLSTRQPWHFTRTAAVISMRSLEVFRSHFQQNRKNSSSIVISGRINQHCRLGSVISRKLDFPVQDCRPTTKCRARWMLWHSVKSCARQSLKSIFIPRFSSHSARGPFDLLQPSVRVIVTETNAQLHKRFPTFIVCSLVAAFITVFGLVLVAPIKLRLGSPGGRGWKRFKAVQEEIWQTSLRPEVLMSLARPA